MAPYDEYALDAAARAIAESAGCVLWDHWNNDAKQRWRGYAKAALDAHSSVLPARTPAPPEPNLNPGAEHGLTDAKLAAAWHAGFCKGEQSASRDRPVDPGTITPYKNTETP